MESQAYTPTVRAALLAALETPSHSLRRGPGGYVAFGRSIRTSGPASCEAFTRRVVNWLERDGLAEFDDPMYPTTVTLTNAGVSEAQRIKDQGRARVARP